MNQGHRETSPRASEQELEAREKLEMRVLGRATQAVLGGLRPWSHYVVAVAVLNGRGAGPFSEEMHFNTPEGGETSSSSPPPPAGSSQNPLNPPGPPRCVPFPALTPQTPPVPPEVGKTPWICLTQPHSLRAHPGR